MELQTNLDDLRKRVTALVNENAAQRALLVRGSQEIDRLLKEVERLNEKSNKAVYEKAVAQVVGNTWKHLYTQQAVNYEYVNKRLMEVQGAKFTVN